MTPEEQVANAIARVTKQADEAASRKAKQEAGEALAPDEVRAIVLEIQGALF